MQKINWYNHPDRAELEKAHKVLARSCGIKKGDTVKVLRKAESYELGWSELWSGYKDEAVGNIFKVQLVQPDGNIAVGNKQHGQWYFSFFVLEIVEHVPEIKLTIDGKEVPISEETLENIRKEL